MPAAADAAPIAAAEFAAALAPLGPFEPAPRLAVAVSGGGDSMALALLADAWAREHDGRVIALIVDHGLRPEAAAEARQVARWLAARGLAPRILRWRGAKPAGDLQAAARAARYRLLTTWCRRQGVLHLLVGHHREDQAETLLLNLARGTGVDGLAAMPPATAVDGVRLLRPLLAVAKVRLVATMRAFSQAWIEDPSNVAPRFRRTAARALSAAALAPLAPGEVTPARLAERLAETAARMARARQALELATTALLARAATLSPHGFATLDAAAIEAAPEEIALRALARVVVCIGGGEHAPRHDTLCRALATLGRAGITLAGCRFVPMRDGVLVCREPAAVGPSIALEAAVWACWDSRFRVRVARGGCFVAALGAVRIDALAAVPAIVRPVLPALFDRRGLLAVPTLGFRRAGAPASVVIFRPPRPLAALALPPRATM